VLRQGTFPTAWTSFFRVPIFKKGDRGDIKNYRGIAILSAIPKLFEKLVFNVLSPIFPSLIHNDQQSFMMGRSSSSNLVSITSLMIDSIEGENQVDVGYTDFSKAFDKVNHSLVSIKLDWKGFYGK
jgi:Reverse transcriptase (RNA-dependent DNA polymerase)